MLLTGFDRADSLAQLITVSLIFILVLVLALWTTRWIARYQKGQRTGSNIDIVETYPIGNGKYIQIVRLADSYVAIAVCKDTVTLLAELPKEQIEFPVEGSKGVLRFGDLLHKAKASYLGGEESPEENASKEEE